MKLLVFSIRMLFLLLFTFLIFKGNMMIWLGLFIVSTILAVFFGRIYCGYICPMNTLMEPTQWLSKKLKIQSDNVPKWLASEKLSLVVLIVSVLSVIIFKKIFSANIPILPILLIISLAMTLRFKPAIFHNNICPFGFLQKLSGRFSLFSKTVISHKCVGCKLCEKECPSNAIEVSKEDKKAVINTAYCYQCGNCSQVCAKSAIVYRKK